MLAMMVIGSVAFTSCSKDDDDDDNKTSNPIVGVWSSGTYDYAKARSISPKKTVGNANLKKAETTIVYEELIEYFSTKGVLTDIYINYDADMNVVGYIFETSKYVVEDNKLTLYYGEEKYEYTFEVVDKQLQLTEIGESDTYVYEYKGKNVPSSYFNEFKKLLCGYAWMDKEIYYDDEENTREIAFVVFNTNGTLYQYECEFDNTTNKLIESSCDEAKWSLKDFVINVKDGPETAEVYGFIQNDYMGTYVFDGFKAEEETFFDAMSLDDPEILDIINNTK